jgi:hypothetical protein
MREAVVGNHAGTTYPLSWAHAHLSTIFTQQGQVVYGEQEVANLGKLGVLAGGTDAKELEPGDGPVHEETVGADTDNGSVLAVEVYRSFPEVHCDEVGP